MAVPMTEGHVLCRILGPFKFYADADDRGISPHLILDGYWEPRTTEAIVDRLKPGMTAIDVGANLGYFTILMSLLVGPRGHVLALEPNPDAVRRLAGSLLINGLGDRVDVHQELVGEIDGREVNLVIPKHFSGGAHATAHRRDGHGNLDVRTRRLDGLPGAANATLVKIDAEGMEEAIWQGMTAMIAGPNLRCIVMEFTKDSYADAGALLDDVIGAGFSLKRLHDDVGVVPTSREEVLGGAWLQMLLFER